MQLTLIAGIVFAICAVIFALQNSTTVTVTLAFWVFEGSLALVLLITLGLGALIAGLLTSPAMIRHQWTVSRMSRQISDLESRLAGADKRNAELAAELSKTPGDAAVAMQEEETEKPYVGLRALIAGVDKSKPPQGGNPGGSGTEK